MDFRSDDSGKKEKMKGMALIFLLILLVILGLWFQKAAIRETGPCLENAAAQLKAGKPVGKALEVFLERNYP